MLKMRGFVKQCEHFKRASDTLTPCAYHNLCISLNNLRQIDTLNGTGVTYYNFVFNQQLLITKVWHGKWVFYHKAEIITVRKKRLPTMHWNSTKLHLTVARLNLNIACRFLHGIHITSKSVKKMNIGRISFCSPLQFHSVGVTFVGPFSHSTAITWFRVQFGINEHE